MEINQRHYVVAFILIFLIKLYVVVAFSTSILVAEQRFFFAIFYQRFCIHRYSLTSMRFVEKTFKIFWILVTARHEFKMAGGLRNKVVQKTRNHHIIRSSSHLPFVQSSFHSQVLFIMRAFRLGLFLKRK